MSDNSKRMKYRDLGWWVIGKWVPEGAVEWIIREYIKEGGYESETD